MNSTTQLTWDYVDVKSGIIKLTLVKHNIRCNNNVMLRLVCAMADDISHVSYTLWYQANTWVLIREKIYWTRPFWRISHGSLFICHWYFQHDMLHRPNAIAYVIQNKKYFDSNLSQSWIKMMIRILVGYTVWLIDRHE